MKNKNNLVVRIVAIVLVVLMVLSVGAVLFQTLAADTMVPVTGSDPRAKWPIFILIGAVVLVAVLAIVPTMKKKK